MKFSRLTLGKKAHISFENVHHKDLIEYNKQGFHTLCTSTITRGQLRLLLVSVAVFSFLFKTKLNDIFYKQVLVGFNSVRYF